MSPRLWIAIGAVNAASTLAAAFTASNLVRVGGLAVAVASAFVLAVLGARSDRRVEEAHARIVELAYDVGQAALAANSAHLLAQRPVLERQQEEQYAMIVKPIDDALKRAFAAGRSLLLGARTRGVD